MLKKNLNFRRRERKTSLKQNKHNIERVRYTLLPKDINPKSFFSLSKFCSKLFYSRDGGKNKLAFYGRIKKGTEIYFR